MKTGHRKLSRGLASLALIFVIFSQSSCQTAKWHESRAERLKGIYGRGDLLVFISPERQLGAVVKGFSPLLDAQLEASKGGPIKLTSIKQFETSAALTAFAASVSGDRYGDSRTYTNSICVPAEHPCVAECTPFMELVPIYPYKSNWVVRFKGSHKDQIIIQNHSVCIRTNIAAVCTEYYQVYCIKHIYSDTACMNAIPTQPPRPIMGWTCGK
jgi:hypothetical protein